MVKSTINGPFSIAMLVYQRVIVTLTIIVNIISPQFISPLTVVNDIPMRFPYYIPDNYY